MQAIRVHHFGGLDSLVAEDVPRPAPGDGELLLRVKAAGVGPWDAWIRSGRSVLPQPLPLTLGSDVAGLVEYIGAGVPQFRLAMRCSAQRTSVSPVDTPSTLWHRRRRSRRCPSEWDS